MAETIWDSLVSDSCYVALLRNQPASPFNLANVVAAGLVSVQKAALGLLASQRIMDYRGFGGGVVHTITQQDLDSWPWGVALMTGNPPTALLSVREGSCKPPPAATVGEEIRIRYEVWATEGGTLNVE